VSTVGIVYLTVYGLLLVLADAGRISQIGKPRKPVTTSDAITGVVLTPILFAFAFWAVVA
jgi:hypothetical protein